MKRQVLLLSLCASIIVPACSASSPDAFIEKQMKYACQHVEQCEPEEWAEAGFESVGDCADTVLDSVVGHPFFGGAIEGEETLRDSFVEDCDDFDRGAARKCLAAVRKTKGDCDVEMVDEPACDEVCGTAQNAGLELGNPISHEVVARALAAMEVNGELEIEIEIEIEGE